MGTSLHTTAATFTADAATITGHGKIYIVNEFGWDRTDWKSQADLQQVLDALAKDPNVSGDDFWALPAHLDNFGFRPIPANAAQLPYAKTGESGHWWALYYPGVTTLVNTAEDMAQRTQQLRTHAYAMAGTAVPQHMIPPRPVITSIVIGGLIAWRGSLLDRAQRRRFSRSENPLRPLRHRHRRSLARFSSDFLGAQYRVTAWTADGAPSGPSEPR